MKTTARYTVFLMAMLLCSSVSARPVYKPTYSELQSKADVVLLLEVLNINEARIPEPNPDESVYRAYAAHCKVLATLKGRNVSNAVSIPFFQHPTGLSGRNGVISAPFSLDKRVRYLAFLKKMPDGRLLPVTGHLDAGVSIKMILEEPDRKYFKMPQPGAEPDGPANGSQPIRSETNRTSSAAGSCR